MQILKKKLQKQASSSESSMLHMAWKSSFRNLCDRANKSGIYGVWTRIRAALANVHVSASRKM